MSEEAKIHLSAFEMELVNNTQWIFTKQIIIDKIYDLFGQLHDDYKRIVALEKEFLPIEFQKPGGKIAKGERYNGLPYIILDYPAIFSKENILAVRTMFWWGNFFSISLHLSGEYYKYLNDISECLVFLKQKSFFVCVNENEWEHDFHSSNFIDINELDEKQKESMKKKRFFKFSKKIELEKWETIPFFLEQAFKEIIIFLKINFPNGEKVL
ncbi:MAG TPA: hypothetical protein VMU83_25070 [Hanamia sp.]|nr:hypothetical protein [Hanamia sp.]